MTRKKKTEDKTPIPMAIDKSERLSHHDAVLVHGGKPLVVESQPAPDRVKVGGVTFVARGEGAEVCPICGTIRTTDVCAIDGHHFEAR